MKIKTVPILLILLVIFCLLITSYVKANNNIINFIIAENEENKNKINSFQAELEMLSSFQNQTFLKKGYLYFKKDSINKAKTVFNEPEQEIMIYYNNNLVFAQINGEDKTEEFRNSDDCTDCQSNENIPSFLNDDLAGELYNINIISITTNEDEYEIVGKEKNSQNNSIKRVFIINKITSMLIKSKVVDQQGNEFQIKTIQYEKINDIWIYKEIKNEIFFPDLGAMVPYIIQFKNIKVNENISDDVFQY